MKLGSFDPSIFFLPNSKTMPFEIEEFLTRRIFCQKARLFPLKLGNPWPVEFFAKKQGSTL